MTEHSGMRAILSGDMTGVGGDHLNWSQGLVQVELGLV